MPNIFSDGQSTSCVHTAQATHALCTSVELVRSANGAEERGWRAPGFHGHKSEAAVGTHPALGPATVAAPQNERMERERELTPRRGGVM